nr:MAG TPA: hypothetical protein [Caudoviricetes sp.]
MYENFVQLKSDLFIIFNRMKIRFKKFMDNAICPKKQRD